MKLKFIKKAKDKNNGAMYEQGKTYDFDEQRAAEILAVKVDGKPVAVEAEKKAVKNATEKTADKATKKKAADK